MKRNFIVMIVMGLFMLVGLFAASQFLSEGSTIDLQAFSTANQLYEAGHYQEAEKIYEQLLSQGMTDSSIYYNLGNTNFKQGDLGRAILNYQRASQLEPRDADIKANLALARSQSVKATLVESTGPVQSLADLTSAWLSLNESAFISLSVWFVFTFLIFAYRQFQPGKLRTVIQYGAMLTVFLALAAGVAFGSRLYIEQTRPGGVIVAPVVTISSSPGDEYATEYSLFSGTEVNLLETRGNWVLLAGPGGALEGWIPLDTVEPIVNVSRSEVPQF